MTPAQRSHDGAARRAVRRFPIEQDTWLFSRRHTARRVGRVPIADYLNGFRIAQDVIRDVLLEAADAAGSPE
jgi:hypothetical protein